MGGEGIMVWEGRVLYGLGGEDIIIMFWEGRI